MTCDQSLACCVAEARKAIPPLNLATLIPLSAPVFIGVGQPLPIRPKGLLTFRVKVGGMMSFAVAPDPTGVALSIRIVF